ncbi:MAG: sensor histidine kinase [Flavobacteriaceae bacterium]
MYFKTYFLVPILVLAAYPLERFSFPFFVLLESSIALPIFVSNFVTIALIVFFGRDRTKQREAYKNQIARLESQSLKAQMNPHFIFNTLNGIQSVMILKGEQVANQYMGVFSKMLRKTLDMSITENLSLMEEIEYLQGYIDLQNIRLNHPIEFTVEVDPLIDQEKYMIAPMLLQPIVENAIIHGISPLKTQGKILLKISKKGKGLHLIVEDNGVGRSKAQLLKKEKEKDGKKHVSYATRILKERVDIFNYLHKTKSEFYLEELVEQDQVCGTRAVLIIPIITNKKQWIT